MFCLPRPYVSFLQPSGGERVTNWQRTYNRLNIGPHLTGSENPKSNLKWTEYLQFYVVSFANVNKLRFSLWGKQANVAYWVIYTRTHHRLPNGACDQPWVGLKILQFHIICIFRVFMFNFVPELCSVKRVTQWFTTDHRGLRDGAFGRNQPWQLQNVLVFLYFRPTGIWGIIWNSTL